MFWKKEDSQQPTFPSPTSTEAEFDIEGLDVFVVERGPDSDTTEFAWAEKDGKQSTWWVSSTDEQHRAFVARFTTKLKAREANLMNAATAPNSP